MDLVICRGRLIYRADNGAGTCKDRPLFFKQCVCDPDSYLGKPFCSKSGVSLAFLPQSTIPIWRKEFAKVYDVNESRTSLQLSTEHGKYGKGHSLTRADHIDLRCEYSEEMYTSMQGKIHESIARSVMTTQGHTLWK